MIYTRSFPLNDPEIDSVPPYRTVVVAIREPIDWVVTLPVLSVTEISSSTSLSVRGLPGYVMRICDESGCVTVTTAVSAAGALVGLTGICVQPQDKNNRVSIAQMQSMGNLFS